MNIYKWISKRKQISTHVEKVEFNIGLFIVSVWIVKSGECYYLIDTGMGRMGMYVIEQYIGKENVSKIKAIILTHGHSDHAGGLQHIQANYPHIPVIIESIEIQYLLGEVAYPKRKKPEKTRLSQKGIIPLASEAAQKMLESSGLHALFTPGHSPGHTSFYHKQDNVLLAGDMFTTNKKGRLQPPMKSFTADMTQALQTGEKILKKYPNCLLSVTHGGEMINPFIALKKASWYKEGN